MEYIKTNKNLYLVLLVVVLYLKLVVHLGVMSNLSNKLLPVIKELKRVTSLVTDYIVWYKLQRLILLLCILELFLLLLWLCLPSVHGLFYAYQHLSRDIEHYGIYWLEWPKNWVILLVVSKFVEDEIRFLKNRLPLENDVIEVINS